MTELKKSTTYKIIFIYIVITLVVKELFSAHRRVIGLLLVVYENVRLHSFKSPMNMLIIIIK